MGMCGSSPKETESGPPRSESSSSSSGGCRSDDGEAASSVPLRSTKKKRILPEYASSLSGDGDELEPAVFQKSEESLAVIFKALDETLIFSGLDAAQKAQVAASMQECKVAAGEVVIRQGDPGDAFYVVESGSFDIQVDSRKVAESSSSFGELALIWNQPRAASVVARTDAVCWKIDRGPFRYFVAKSSKTELDETYADLTKVRVLAGLPMAHLYKLAAHASKETFEQGQTIIRKGEVGDKFYMLKKGSVECANFDNNDDDDDDEEEAATSPVVRLSAGSHFGELALTTGAARAADVVALDKVECITLSKSDFEALLGPVHEAMERQHVVNVVNGLRNNNNNNERAEACAEEEDEEEDDDDDDGLGLSEASLYEQVEQGVAAKGSVLEGNKFYLIQSGSVRLRSGSKSVLTEMDHFRGTPADALTEVSFYALPEAALPGSSQRRRNKDTRTKRSSHLEPQLDDKFARGLTLGRTLGTGTFGRVRLATLATQEDNGGKKKKKTKKNKQPFSGEVFAVKMLSKRGMIELNQAESVELERRILAELCGHPFVLRCHATFQTASKCCFVLEFVQGGELFSRVEGGVSENESSFHATCVLDALDHIHRRSIVYRDLKPENVLLDHLGFAKIVDFGFAKPLAANKAAGSSSSGGPRGVQKTYTILGTPEYLSPECVLGKGYAFDVDLWAFGVLVYETLTGRSPFYANDPDDTMTIFRSIVAAKVKMPKASKHTPKAENFVLRLLKRDAKDRLGARRGAADIKEHPFLAKYAEALPKLRTRDIAAPYKPSVASHLDTSHFDQYPEDDDDDDDDDQDDDDHHLPPPPPPSENKSNDPFANFGPTLRRPFRS